MSVIQTEPQRSSMMRAKSLCGIDVGWEISPAIIVWRRGLIAVWDIENKMADMESGVVLLAPYYSTQLTLNGGTNQLSLYPAEVFESEGMSCCG